MAKQQLHIRLGGKKLHSSEVDGVEVKVADGKLTVAPKKAEGKKKK